MGGIKASKNFLGTNTMKAGSYAAGEQVLKTLPLFMFFIAFGQSGKIQEGSTIPTVVVEGDAPLATESRRSSLID